MSATTRSTSSPHGSASDERTCSSLSDVHVPSSRRFERPSDAHSHACWVQAPSGAVQIPQLSLQQTWPAPHVAFPHCAPVESAASGMQTPLPSCDSHRESVAQVIAAHGCVPPMHDATGGHGARTHCTVLRSQNPSPQSRPAQGSPPALVTGAGPSGGGGNPFAVVVPPAGSPAAGVVTVSVDVDVVGGALGFSLHAPMKHPRPIQT